MKFLIIFLSFSLLLIFPGILESEGLRQSAKQIVVEISPGESKTFSWTLISESDFDDTLEISSLAWGSQFLSHPSSLELGSFSKAELEVTVTIPEDHPGDVELHPKVRAKQVGTSFGGGGGAVLNIVMQTIPTIIIEKNSNSEYWTNTAYDEPEAIIQEEAPVEEAAAEEEEEERSMMMIAPEEDSSESQEVSTTSEEGGGCLIATATYGSEMAQQVQLLREIRDDKLLSTPSGTSFMAGFNSLYYSFSPTIADLERQNPIFKEAVKLTITPLITSLSILNYVDIDSEADVLSYGISLILLNIGMYFVAPAVLIRTAILFTRK